MAEDVGEWAFYLVFGMLALTLLKHFSYKFWLYLHRIMPVLYLLLVFQAAWLTSLSWWQKMAEVWFCGPKGLAKQLETSLKQALPGSLLFRKEAFELR